MKITCSCYLPEWRHRRSQTTVSMRPENSLKGKNISSTVKFIFVVNTSIMLLLNITKYSNQVWYQEPKNPDNANVHINIYQIITGLSDNKWYSILCISNILKLSELFVIWYEILMALFELCISIIHTCPPPDGRCVWLALYTVSILTWQLQQWISSHADQQHASRVKPLQW